MSSFLLNWTPAGGLNSSGQEVQYKLSTAGTWTTAATVSASANTYTVTGLLDNTIYDFQIVNLCSFGGPTTGTNFRTVHLTCPTVGFSVTYSMVTFGFTDLEADITEYRVDLLNAAGNTVLAFKTIASTSGEKSDSFLGLSASTNYQLRVTVKAGTYTKQCPLIPFTTAALPSCTAPSGLSVTIS